MASREDHLAKARRIMLDRHLRGRGISDQRVLDAFAAVPRERFVATEDLACAYEDHPLSIGYGQTISQPYIVAEMVQQLQLGPDDRVLDVGAGSGYQTAILARLAGHVYAVERIDALARRAQQALTELGIENVTLSTHDGSLGWPEEAPFDGIISGAAAPTVPAAWKQQLVDGGRIVAPIGAAYAQRLIVLARGGDQWYESTVCGVRFVRLVGQQGWAQE